MNFVLCPVTYATLHLNYLFDGFNPRWYRLFNVTIHALNACLIYAVLQMLLIMAKSSMNITSKRRVSAIAATLFAVHPLAIESVTYIVQRFIQSHLKEPDRWRCESLGPGWSRWRIQRRSGS